MKEYLGDRITDIIQGSIEGGLTAGEATDKIHEEFNRELDKVRRVDFSPFQRGLAAGMRKTPSPSGDYVRHRDVELIFGYEII